MYIMLLVLIALFFALLISSAIIYYSGIDGLISSALILVILCGVNVYNGYSSSTKNEAQIQRMMANFNSYEEVAPKRPL